MKALACIAGAIVLAIMSAAPVAAIDITFDDVVSLGNPIVTLLDTHGYRFTGAFRTIDAPGTTFVGSSSALYLAQPAGLPAITLSRTDGSPFALYELEAAGLLVDQPSGAPNADKVTLLGVQVGGATLSESFALAGSGFTHVAVPATWTNLQVATLSGLTAAGLSGGLAVDDVGVGTGPDSSVAEPGTLLLFTITAIGASTALLRARQRGAPARGLR